MSKELTPLEAYYKLDHTCCLNNVIMQYNLIEEDKDCDCRDMNELVDCLDIIETALNKLEGLEKVYKVAKDYEEELTKDRNYWRNEAYKKQLKALEIIKEKVMPLVCLDDGEILKGHYRVYDGEIYGYTELTKEEYDLLKEVLL